MKAKKILAILLASTMVMSVTACGNEAPAPETPAAEETVEEEAPAPAAPAAVTIENPSTDFSDGQYGFIGNDKVCNPSADDSVLTMSEFNGTPAVKVEPCGKMPFVAIQMDAMVGDKIADVASVAVTVGVESQDGTFYAASGNVMAVIGGEKAASNSWSVYKADGNPKVATLNLGQTAAEGDYVVVSLESDVANDNGAGQQSMYILDVTFMDADGNTIDVDTSALYVAASTGADRSNLFGITGDVTVDLAGKGDGWAQIGYQDLTDEEWEALTTPGSVVEISYAAETGNIWMGLSGNAWTRLGVGDCDGSGQGYAYYNSSRSVAQITYETIASVCGDDTSAWDRQIFIESDGAFEVYSIKIGQQAPNCILAGGIDIEVSGSGDGWAQIGYVDIPEDAYEVLKTPGSMVKIEYSSATDDIWMGLSGNAWTRVGVGDADGSGSVDAITDGSVCYVTYDMIAAACGDDPEAWDRQIFIESNDKFEVYSVTVGMAAELPAVHKIVDTGISGSGDGWAQIGYVDLEDDAYETLITPGSVVVIEYSSATDDIWMGLNGDAWLRVGVGDADGSGSVDAITTGKVCYVTYDMIASVAGEDSSTWARNIFIESNDKFEVYSVSVGLSE